MIIRWLCFLCSWVWEPLARTPGRSGRSIKTTACDNNSNNWHMHSAVCWASHDSKSFTYVNQFIIASRVDFVGVKTKQKPNWVLPRFVHWFVSFKRAQESKNETTCPLSRALQDLYAGNTWDTSCTCLRVKQWSLVIIISINKNTFLGSSSLIHTEHIYFRQSPHGKETVRIHQSLRS